MAGEKGNKAKGVGRRYLRLGELLISAGMLTEKQLEEGIALQKDTGKRLGTVLLENGFITESELIEALQMQLGIEFIDLTKVKIPTELAQVVPKNIAKQYQVVPVRVIRDELYLAMQDPLNFYAIEEVRKAVHRRVVPMVATAAAVERAIQVLYGNEGAAKAIEEMRLRCKREAQAKVRKEKREFRKRQKRNAAHRRWYRKTHPKKYKGKTRGRKPARKNEKFRPTVLSTGDTLVELFTRTKYALTQTPDKWSERTKERMDLLFTKYPQDKAVLRRG